MRTIPSIMATQHPDNAFAPYWEKDGDGFISTYEELEECVSAFKDLDVDEYMWDWEGKYADEAVVDKLFARYYDFFKKKNIGRDKFLTFRLPNIWHEKGYSLIRALLVILTSQDFARDLKFHCPPLFEVIIPMVEKAEQIMYIQKSFNKLSHFKVDTFNHCKHADIDYLEMIPLVESVESQMNIGDLLEEYIREHKKYFGRYPKYIRPFLARSDPALVSGLAATVLANKVALSEIEKFARKYKIPCYPIIGVGSLVFRGGLSPRDYKPFLKQYGGVRTVTVQSSFRYDYDLRSVKRGIGDLRRKLPATKADLIDAAETSELRAMIKKFANYYQHILDDLLSEMENIFAAVPERRERRLHTGLLAYKRKMGKHSMPRAITFTAGFYSLGIPPEFIGLGRSVQLLSESEKNLLKKYYSTLSDNLKTAGAYLNTDNLKILAAGSSMWNCVLSDVSYMENMLGLKFGPLTKNQKLHKNLTTNTLLLRHNSSALRTIIDETAKLRRSLG